MTSAEYDELYRSYLSQFNDALDDEFKKLKSEVPTVLTDAMKYAVGDGGKRVRPVLCFAANSMLGGKPQAVKEFALALEFIHSYSLVHDDLPAMDNDDYRRGKLSTHKKFGEAYGILAGDALLNYAFEICLSKENFRADDLAASRIIAEYAGYGGMIAGQTLDLLSEKDDCPDEKTLFDIYVNKTSKLLTAPLLVASVKNGNAYYAQLEKIGTYLGIMFQITDDILDEESSLSVLGKTPHKDKQENKLTSVKIYGLDGAKDKSRELYGEIIRLLNDIPDSDFLKSFAGVLYGRKY